MEVENLLMQREEEHRRRLELEDEVVRLQEMLENEQKLSRVLRCALHRPFMCHSCIFSSVTCQVKVLLREIAKVQAEIIYLERKVEELKLKLYQQPYQQLQWDQRQQRNLLCESGDHGAIGEPEQFPDIEKMTWHLKSESSSNVDFVTEAKGIHSMKKSEEDAETKGKIQKPHYAWGLRYEQACRDSPNKLSENLIKALICIFHKISVSPVHLGCEKAAATKIHISCMRSKSLIHTQEGNEAARDIGPYKEFIQIMRSTVDMNRIELCFPTIEKLRFLMHKLVVVELRFLSYKQRLAFWINIYNASIMHAFLQHGLPTCPGKLLELLNKAAFNVGGVVLNALAIEHFILRHSSDTKYGMEDKKRPCFSMPMDLVTPEPNITFALCRGSWSSPALRVYTAENVMNELERAKVEFLEASVCITCKRKMVLPQLLQWHMQDFADDIESLIEWIYSQLPRTGSLKRSMMEWLSGEYKVPLSKMVEIHPYEAEFRYLLPTY
ncbi:hypothetical protein HPP92_028240 [Vanilla planifolia]|uniref:DUF547 domain-containing protein n=1 Tax=Vanilla planifolia TaxID=51239 RepID=A0A835P814_VANPL|nr:hypothetical protein HPP92_028240 [Vanilla planifolia]